MKKILLFLMACLVFASCGDDDDDRRDTVQFNLNLNGTYILEDYSVDGQSTTYDIHNPTVGMKKMWVTVSSNNQVDLNCFVYQDQGAYSAYVSIGQYRCQLVNGKNLVFNSTNFNFLNTEKGRMTISYLDGSTLVLESNSGFETKYRFKKVKDERNGEYNNQY